MKKIISIVLLLVAMSSYGQKFNFKPISHLWEFKYGFSAADSVYLKYIVWPDGSIQTTAPNNSSTPQSLDSVLATNNEAWEKWANLFGVVLQGGFYSRYYTDSSGLSLQFLTDFTNPADPAGFILNALGKTIWQHTDGNYEPMMFRYLEPGVMSLYPLIIDTSRAEFEVPIILKDGTSLSGAADFGTGGTDAATVDSIAFYNKFRILSAADNGSNILASDEDKALVAEGDSVYLVLPAGLGMDSISFLSALGLGTAEWTINASAVTLEYNGDTVAEANFQQAQLMHVWGDYYKLYKVDTTGGAVFTPLTKEQVQDFVGEMFINNTEERIDIVYDDINDEIDAIVNPDLSLYDNTNSGFAYDNQVSHPGDNLSDFVNDQNFISTESDPAFTGSEAASITAGDKNNWNTGYAQKARVDKLFFERYQITSNFLLTTDAVWTRQYNLGASGYTVTIPQDFIDMAVGDQIIFQAIGGDIDIAADTGVTLNGVVNSSVTINSPYAARVLEKIADNEFILYVN